MFLENNLGTAERSFCECDLEFVNSADGLEIENKNYDTSKCVTASGSGNGACCNSGTGLYNFYNTQRSECCNGLIVKRGEC